MRAPQRLPDPNMRWTQQDGRLTREAYQYLRELDEVIRALIGEPIPLPSYAVLNVPDPSLYIGSEIYVPNEIGGAVTAFSDGARWRRSTDRAIIS